MQLLVMDKLIKVFMTLDLINILRGLEIDLSVLSEEQLALCAHLLAHCAFNGPVGVSKATVFPTGERGSIKALLNAPNLSNSSWKNVADRFVDEIMKIEEIKADIEKSQQFRIHAKLWPKWEVPK